MEPCGLQREMEQIRPPIPIMGLTGQVSLLFLLAAMVFPLILAAPTPLPSQLILPAPSLAQSHLPFPFLFLFLAQVVWMWSVIHTIMADIPTFPLL